jgi:hypothetical protein
MLREAGGVARCRVLPQGPHPSNRLRRLYTLPLEGQGKPRRYCVTNSPSACALALAQMPVP